MMSFFFARRHATGFGAMRIAWATVTLLSLLIELGDASLYYGESGLIPSALSPFMQRTDWRFAPFEWLAWIPYHSALLYGVLLLALITTAVGRYTRISTVTAAALIIALHERNTFILGGGDTVMRLIGLLLAISPGIHALSLDRLRAQRTYWLAHSRLLPVVDMPAWPWRLLLWQMIVLYGMSLWTKLLGSAWLHGSAVDMALHNPLYSRIAESADMFTPLSPLLSWLILLFQALWLLLLIPLSARRFVLGKVGTFPLLRALLVCGVVFHGSIALFLDAGIFSYMMMVAYLGLISTEDIAALRRRLPGTARDTTVLYDGRCRLCMQSAFLLHILDRTHRLRLVNFRESTARTRHAPTISEEALDRAMHIRLPDGSYRAGFEAFRRLCATLPVLWILLPFMYFPGVSVIGKRVYGHIANRRHMCADASCNP